jgi:hypothetical protein
LTEVQIDLVDGRCEYFKRNVGARGRKLRQLIVERQVDIVVDRSPRIDSPFPSRRTRR